jgi:Uma2 family endonuclease
MSSNSPTTNTRQQPPTLPVRRFTVEEYQSIIAHGIMKDNEIVELLQGLIVRKMTRTPSRDIALELADENIRGVLLDGWRIRIQSAVATDDSLPDPDVAVVRGHARSRRGRHPTAAEVGLMVEIADASLERDRGEKAAVYAAARIACYWIINLIDRQIEVYTVPGSEGAGARFHKQQIYHDGETVPLALDGKVVAHLPVAGFLP